MSKPGFVDIHGKSYEVVASRLMRMKKDHETWVIQTEIIHHDDKKVIMRAVVGEYTSTDNVNDVSFVIIGTGHAEEFRADGKINKTSALENCETSAIGRALAACGYATVDDYASGDEMVAIAESSSAYTDTEKDIYDHLQLELDSLGMYAFRKRLSKRFAESGKPGDEESVFIALYNSHPPGKKMELKDLTNSLAKEGLAAWNQLMEACMNYDNTACFEALDGITDTGKRILWDILDEEQQKFIVEASA